MTTNKPEIVAYLSHEFGEVVSQQEHAGWEHDAFRNPGTDYGNYLRDKTLKYSEPLICLSDYEALQAECDALVKALEGLERLAKVVSDNSDAVCGENNQLRVECEKLRKDAELYRALRAMHWHSSPLAVVQNPKEAVKPGTYCPSGNQLDEILKEYMSETQNPGEA